MGVDYSSKLSPWLANGSLSIRQVYHMTRKFEREVKKNESTAHYINELFWRDFCHFYCARHGNKVFQSYGISKKPIVKWKTNEISVKRWKEGMTGIPLIDAFMRELNQTGFMGNRGRQIVAAFLTLDLE